MGSKSGRRSVFISHAWTDAGLALELAEALAQAGVPAVISAKPVLAAEDWVSELEHELRSARTMVVLLTPKSVESASLLFEVGAAIADSKTIIPVLLEGIRPEDVPGVLRKHGSVQARTPRQAAEGIAAAIKAPA